MSSGGIRALENADATTPANTSAGAFAEGIIAPVNAAAIIPGVEVVCILTRDIEIQKSRLGRGWLGAKTEREQACEQGKSQGRLR